MTIIYQYRVATASLGGFVKLLAVWKGSVYKLMFKEMLIFGVFYTFISLMYRLALPENQKRIFERIVIYCNSFTSLIPVSFVLGFYVSFVIRRWWQQFMNVPWPDRTLFIMNTYLHGHEDRPRIMRRSVARYMLFGMILICRSVSVAVLKRFPTLDHIVEAGFITKDEALLFENTQCQYNKFWVPLMWANSILVDARKEGKIENDFGLRMITEQLADFRDKCSLCFVYDWITIPLVYTQVVTLAVYTFFAACLLGRQFLDPTKSYDGYEYDFYIPVFTFLQFFFYMGWLKVAEQLINPFGEDDDDYDINWLLDRHTAVAFALVDQCYGKHPPLVRDHFWNDVVVPDLPYTEASLRSKRPNFLGSTFNIARSGLEDQRMFVPDAHDLRRRSKGSVSSLFNGSVLSLFTSRPLKYYGSRETLQSSYGIQEKAPQSVTNGKAGYLQVPSITLTSDNRRRRASIDVAEILVDDNDERPLQRRARANTDYDERDVPKEKPGRKFSTPFNFNFFSKKDTKKSEPPSPKSSRFVVESVPKAEKTPSGKRRPGQILATLEKQYGKVVSRPTLLSAIEEGNTVTSIRQILPERSPDVSDDDDAFDEADEDMECMAHTFDEKSEDVHLIPEEHPMHHFGTIPTIHIEEY